MNNRTDEFNKMINEQPKLPEALEKDFIRKNTKKRVLRHHIVATARNFAIVFVLMMGVLTIGVNSSSVFASSVKKIPIIGKIAEVVRFNKGIEEAIDNEYGQKTDIVCEGKNYDLYVDYVMADDTTLALFVRTTDDGGLYNCELRVEDMTTIDGEEVHGSAVLPMIKTNGETAMLLYHWENYNDKVSVNLLLRGCDSEWNEKFTEKYSFNLEVPEKYEAKVYNVNKEVNVAEAKYLIKQVRMYPMSTEIEFELLNSDEVYTNLIVFSIMDAKGDKVERIKSTGIEGKVDNDTYISIIESGYFNLSDKLTLMIDSVEILPMDRREITINLDTMEATDKHGKVTDIDIIESDDECIVIKYTGKYKSKYSNFFEGYIDENGEIKWKSEGFRSGNQYLIFPDSVYVNDDNCIKLIRRYPDKIINPEIKIELY